MKVSDPPIVVEQKVQHNINMVWESITILSHLQKWFFEAIPAFEARVGFETKFDIQNESRNFPHVWKITEVIERQKISYNWKYDGYQGDSFVHFELSGNEKETLIRLTTEIVEDFPQDIPEFKRESGIAGWNYFIKDRLPKYLDSLS